MNLIKIKNYIKKTSAIGNITQAMQIIAMQEFAHWQKQVDNLQIYHNELLSLLRHAYQAYQSTSNHHLDWLFSANKQPYSSEQDNIKTLVILLMHQDNFSYNLNHCILEKYQSIRSELSSTIHTLLLDNDNDSIQGPVQTLTLDKLLNVEYLHEQIHEYSSIFVIANNLISTTQYETLCYQLVPFKIVSNNDTDASLNWDIDFYPNVLQFITDLYLVYLKSGIELANCKKNQAETSVRIFNMHSTNSNIEKFIAKSKLLCNKVRQNRITQELIEIVSGINM